MEIGYQQRIQFGMRGNLAPKPAPNPPKLPKKLAPMPTPVAVAPGYHPEFPNVLRALDSGVNVMLVGPAGSGKTHLAEQVAKELKFEFYPQSVGPQTTKSDLIGYMDAQGKYITTPLRKAFELGGVYLLDELDAGNPGVLTILNAALSNCFMSFPDAVIQKHKDFRCIAGANTFGRGSDRKYCGRNRLDAATLNRFAVIYLDYSEELENALVGSALAGRMQALRKRIDSLALEVIVSTRNMLQVKALIETGGFDYEKALELTVFAGIPREQVQKCTC